MTARERQLLYWMREAEEHFKAWKDAPDKETAANEKARYISARKTIDELERRE